MDSLQMQTCICSRSSVCKIHEAVLSPPVITSMYVDVPILSWISVVLAIILEYLIGLLHAVIHVRV